MSTATQTTRRAKRPKQTSAQRKAAEALLESIVGWLDDAKAEDIVTIDLVGKSSIGEFMVIATGTSDRHVGALADELQRKLKDAGRGKIRVEGQQTSDWVVLDVADVIVHLFRAEVRSFYNLEKLWSAERLPDTTH